MLISLEPTPVNVTHVAVAMAAYSFSTLCCNADLASAPLQTSKRSTHAQDGQLIIWGDWIGFFFENSDRLDPKSRSTTNWTKDFFRLQIFYKKRYWQCM